MSGIATVRYKQFNFVEPELPTKEEYVVYKSKLTLNAKASLMPKTTHLIIPDLVLIGFVILAISICALLAWLLSLVGLSGGIIDGFFGLLVLAGMIVLFGCVVSVINYLNYLNDLHSYYSELKEQIQSSFDYETFIESLPEDESFE